MTSPFIIEIIPDTAFLFRYIHKNFCKGEDPNKISTSQFSIHSDQEGLSVDWDKYSSPEKCLYIVSSTYKHNTTEFKNCYDYKVVILPADAIRKIEVIQEIRHNPLYFGEPNPAGKPNNQAHSLIININDEEVRVKLRKLAKFATINVEELIKLLDSEN